jgi:hypothetical protein
MPLMMPVDLATSLQEAKRWYADSREMQAFIAHVRAEHPWSEERPRQLLRWGQRHAIAVLGEKRFLLVLTAGFDCPERWRLWRAAKTELRRARDRIACGEERGLIYADGRDLLVLDSGEPRPRWDAPPSALRPVAYPSVIDSLSPPAAPVTAPPPPPPRPPAGPITPSVTYLTRRG